MPKALGRLGTKRKDMTKTMGEHLESIQSEMQHPPGPLPQAEGWGSVCDTYVCKTVTGKKTTNLNFTATA